MVRARGTSWQLSRGRAHVGSHLLSRSRPQTHSASHAPETTCLGLLGFSSSLNQS